MATAALSAQPQAAGLAAASTVERGAYPGNRRLVPTFTPILFAGWTLVTAGVAAHAARGSISYRVLAPHPDSCCHKIVTTHGPVVKDAGKLWGTLWHGSAANFENAVVEHRRCRLQRSSWNQVNGALRADDIVHETEGMRSNATAAY
jgi:hypothetical protein